MKIFFSTYRIFIGPALAVLFGAQCRFEESCSHYTERQIEEKGLTKGIILGIKRIASCNSYNSNTVRSKQHGS